MIIIKREKVRTIDRSIIVIEGLYYFINIYNKKKKSIFFSFSVINLEKKNTQIILNID